MVYGERGAVRGIRVTPTSVLHNSERQETWIPEIKGYSPNLKQVNDVKK